MVTPWGPELTCPRLQGIAAWGDTTLVVLLFENLHAQEALRAHPLVPQALPVQQR